jgi:hypothetical protein
MAVGATVIGPLGSVHGSLSPRSADRATEVIVYEPFSRDGAVAAGIEVVGERRGANCFEGAIASPRWDAFRCFAPTAGEQDFLADPCFLDHVGRPRLACLHSDNPSDIVLVTPAGPFRWDQDHGPADPADGWGWGWGWGWGSVHRAGAEWTMAYSDDRSLSGHAPSLSEIPIATAWF